MGLGEADMNAMRITRYLFHAVIVLILNGCAPDMQPAPVRRRPSPKPAEDPASVSRSRLTDPSRVEVDSEPLSRSGPEVPAGFRTAAQASAGSGRYINPNKQQVGGYTKQDGTQVGSYIRTQGNSTTQDNLRSP